MPAAITAPPIPMPLATPVARATRVNPTAVAKSSNPPAPDFSIQTLDGKPLSLAAMRGKPVVLFFTASSCGSCIPELRGLARIQKEYGPRVGIVVVSVDPLDTKEDLMRMRSYVGVPIDYPWAIDVDNAVTRAYGVTALETTIMIDGAGRIVYRDQLNTVFAYGVFKRELDKILN